jgi:hypothetical protein
MVETPKISDLTDYFRADTPEFDILFFRTFMDNIEKNARDLLAFVSALGYDSFDEVPDDKLLKLFMRSSF